MRLQIITWDERDKRVSLISLPSRTFFLGKQAAVSLFLQSPLTDGLKKGRLLSRLKVRYLCACALNASPADVAGMCASRHFNDSHSYTPPSLFPKACFATFAVQEELGFFKAKIRASIPSQLTRSVLSHLYPLSRVSLVASRNERKQSEP